MSERVVGIGELLWDLFPDGPRLGGAPFNVVANLRRLGHPAKYATAVGDDALGRRAMASLELLGVDTDQVQLVRSAPTGTVIVRVDEGGAPSFDIVSPAAYESLSIPDHVIDRVAVWKPAAIVYGTLANRFPSVFDGTRRLITACGVGERLYDVNLRKGCWSGDLVRELLALATLVKVNEPEARTLADMLGRDASPVTLGRRLADRYGIKALCVTRGPHGAALWLNGTLHEVSGTPVDVVDTVGAGDAFAAGLLHGLLAGDDPGTVVARAGRLGAFVASRPGALPEWPRTDDSVAGASAE